MQITVVLVLAPAERNSEKASKFNTTLVKQIQFHEQNKKSHPIKENMDLCSKILCRIPNLTRSGQKSFICREKICRTDKFAPLQIMCFTCTPLLNENTDTNNIIHPNTGYNLNILQISQSYHSVGIPIVKNLFGLIETKQKSYCFQIMFICSD